MKRAQLVSMLWAAGAMFTASNASAAVTVGTWSQSFSAQPYQNTYIWVNCPSGAKVVGGGWLADNEVFRIDMSHPSGDSSWLVGGQNLTTSAQTFTGYVRCASGLPSEATVTTPSRFVTIDANTSLGVGMSPNCPSGSIRTALGFSSGSSQATSLSLGSAVFTNPLSTQGWVGLYAACLSNAGAGAHVDEYQSTSISDWGSGYAFSTIACPAGTVPTGGGYSGPWSTDVPYYSGMDVNGWGILIDYWYHSSYLSRAIAFCATFP